MPLKGEVESKKIPFFSGLLFLGVLICIWSLVNLKNNQLPTPKLIKDEIAYPDAFIAERAQQYLKALTDFGPRVVGSYENEVLTVNYLKQEVNKIINQAHINQRIELDVQVVSGAFDLDNPAGGRINVYRNVQNVVVKFYSKSEGNNSFVINAHFDSVPTSPGATDNGINCAILLEIMNKLSKLPQRSLHNTIFLFNGAEETAMQASHGFISQHKWAGETKAVINLDAVGSGGKLVMFLAGPSKPWMTEVYKDAPHPTTSVLFEEIFQANLIPSDTDSRIFRDFGGIPSLDSVFNKDGYRYHTKYDTFEYIPLGSYQNAGENVLAIVRNMMNNTKFSNLNEDGNVVFFDYLGISYILYSITIAYIMNILIIFFSVGVFLNCLVDFKLGLNKNTLIFLTQIVTIILLGWIMSVMIVYLLALVIDGIGYSMSWYANPWLVFGLYVVPIMIVVSGTTLYMTPKNLSPNVSCQIHLHVTRIIWTAILFVITVMGMRTTYIPQIYVLFNTLAFAIIRLLRLQNSVRVWQVIYFTLSIIPTLFLMMLTLNLLQFYISINGRIGNDVNPEVLVGFLSLSLTLLVMSQFISFIFFLRNPLYFILSLVGIFLGCFVLIFTPVGFPYSGNPTSVAPQRFWISHNQRIFHGEDELIVKQDSGFSLFNMDRNSPHSVRNYVPEIQSVVDIKKDCDKYLYCGISLVHPKMSQYIKGSSWIPAGEPILSVPTEMTFNSRKSPGNIITFNITVSGPDRISVFISPKTNVTLMQTSLLHQLPAREGKWNGRPFYYIIYVAGKEIVPLNFKLDFKVPKDHKGATMDIAVAGNYVHEKKNELTTEYRKFLSQFPQWADLTVGLATYECWSL